MSARLRRQLLLYPNGNNRADALALYLAVAEDDQAAFGLQRSATFKLMLLSTVEGGDIVKETQHTFTTRETDWGEQAAAPACPWPAQPGCRAALRAAGQRRRQAHWAPAAAAAESVLRCGECPAAHAWPGPHPWCLAGFTSYIPLVELRDPARGLLTDDTLRMKARWAACRGIRHCCCTLALLPACLPACWCLGRVCRGACFLGVLGGPCSPA